MVLFLFIGVLIPVRVLGYEQLVNIQTGQMTLSGHTSPRTSVSLEIVEGGKRYYLDGFHTELGDYEFRTTLPTNKSYDVLLNEGGNIQHFSLSTKKAVVNDENDESDESDESDMKTNPSYTVLRKGDKTLIKDSVEIEGNKVKYHISSHAMLQVSQSDYIHIEVESKKAHDDRRIQEWHILFSKKAMQSVLNEGVEHVVIVLPKCAMRFKRNALANLSDVATGNLLSIKVIRTNPERVDVAIKSGNDEIHSLGEGFLELRLPYTLNEAQRAEAMTICYKKHDESGGGMNKVIPHNIFGDNDLFFHIKKMGGYEIIGTKSLFDDIDKSEFKDSIEYVSARKIFYGTNKTSFKPHEKMTRAMLVTILGRMEEVDAEKYGEASFKDVAIDSWYGGYVNWAKVMGITDGTSKHTFSPHMEVTRWQISKMMTDYMKLPILNKEIKTWIKENPDEGVTRAEASWIIHEVLKQTMITYE